MRELNACRAEVFRRSEERIQKRRRLRKRMLVWCVLPVVCLAVWTAAVLQPMLSAGNDTAVMDKSDIPEEEAASENVMCAYTTVEIRRAGDFTDDHAQITDQAEVGRILRCVHSLFSDADGAAQGDGAVSESAEDQGKQQTGMDGSTAGYIVTFAGEDGARTVYYLSGNTLVNVSTSERMTLTGAQLAELTAALGLPE